VKKHSQGCGSVVLHDVSTDLVILLDTRAAEYPGDQKFAHTYTAMGLPRAPVVCGQQHCCCTAQMQ
jgi:hypothetical protein